MLTEKVEWVDDVSAVAVAEKMGLTCVSKVIAIKDIDVGKSYENRAREIPLDEARVESISHAMAAGIPIPKIFVRDCIPKFVIAGGNHRYNAIPKSVEFIPVHCTSCTDREFEVFCRVLNTVVGVGMSKNERLRNAVDAVERLDMTRKDAANIYGLPLSAVETAVRKYLVEKKLQAVLGRKKTKLTQTHIVKLGELANNDNVLRAAANYVDCSNATSEELSQLATVARKKSTEADQMAIFAQASEPFKKGKKITIPKKFKKRFLSGLKQIEVVVERKTWQELEIEKAEMEAIKDRVKRVNDALSFLCKASG